MIETPEHCAYYQRVHTERDYEMANVSNQGYEIEKTAGRKFYITSKKYGNIFGPFTRKSWAIDYAKRIDAAA